MTDLTLEALQTALQPIQDAISENNKRLDRIETHINGLVVDMNNVHTELIDIRADVAHIKIKITSIPFIWKIVQDIQKKLRD